MIPSWKTPVIDVCDEMLLKYIFILSLFKSYKTPTYLLQRNAILFNDLFPYCNKGFPKKPRKLAQNDMPHAGCRCSVNGILCG